MVSLYGGHFEFSHQTGCWFKNKRKLRKQFEDKARAFVYMCEDPSPPTCQPLSFFKETPPPPLRTS